MSHKMKRAHIRAIKRENKLKKKLSTLDVKKTSQVDGKKNKKNKKREAITADLDELQSSNSIEGSTNVSKIDLTQLNDESKLVLNVAPATASHSNLKKTRTSVKPSVVELGLANSGQMAQGRLSTFYPIIEKKTTVKGQMKDFAPDKLTGAVTKQKKVCAMLTEKSSARNTDNPRSDEESENNVNCPESQIDSNDVEGAFINAEMDVTDTRDSVENKPLPPGSNDKEEINYVFERNVRYFLGWSSDQAINGKQRLNRSFLFNIFRECPNLRTLRMDDIEWLRLANQNNLRMICAPHSAMILRLLWDHREDFKSSGLTLYLFRTIEEAEIFLNEMLEPEVVSGTNRANASAGSEQTVELITKISELMATTSNISWLAPLMSSILDFSNKQNKQ
ncbi:uncharacterized protein [Ambystoma mexicanum]|uniref:uncharacterized protein isoform X1 n=1 Tax=Ambystoma mexicanum TaxID=8296 RepID=UPI0037E89243